MVAAIVAGNLAMVEHTTVSDFLEIATPYIDRAAHCPFALLRQESTLMINGTDTSIVDQYPSNPVRGFVLGGDGCCERPP
jgi:hypothetical protein